MDRTQFKHEMLYWLMYSPKDCEDMASKLSFADIFHLSTRRSPLSERMFKDQFCRRMFEFSDLAIVNKEE
jgi:hypothetical protein